MEQDIKQAGTDWKVSRTRTKLYNGVNCQHQEKGLLMDCALDVVDQSFQDSRLSIRCLACRLLHHPQHQIAPEEAHLIMPHEKLLRRDFIQGHARHLYALALH